MMRPDVAQPADLEEGTLTGEITESWVCDGDCLASDGSPSYATTMDTGWTATLGEVRLTPDGSGWDIEGTVSIAYHAAVTSQETPSECNGEACYICEDQLCVIGERMTATADIEGWIDGRTVSLAFQDRLEPDAGQMDFDGLRDTQFFMARFSATVTGTVPAAALPPPEEPADSGGEDSPASESGQVDTPAEGAPTDDSAPEEAVTTDDNSSASDEGVGSAVPAPITDSDKGGSSRTGLFVAIMIILVLLFGVAFLVKIRPALWQGLRPVKPDPPPVDPMFDPANLDADPGDSPPLEDALDPVPLPPTIYPVGSEVSTATKAPTEANPYLDYELIAPDGASFIEGTGRQADNSPFVARYSVGAIVKVVGRAGDAVKIQYGTNPPIWVGKANVRPVATAGPK